MNFHNNCAACKSKCDGKSRTHYNFEHDVQYSERTEDQIIQQLNDYGFYAKKTENRGYGYPDIEVYEHKDGPLKCFIEVKSVRRTFMDVSNKLPEANLTPSETMTLNTSDLVRYIYIADKEPVPVYVLWCLRDRDCIVQNNEASYFFQNVDVLKSIFNEYGHKRTFTRRSVSGDVVNGKHLGVLENYHFSLDELLPFSPDMI